MRAPEPIPAAIPGLQNATRSNGAFTLVEAVVASGILALLISGSVALMTFLNRYASATRLQTLALTVAQEKTSEILAIPWKIKLRPPLLNETVPGDPPSVLPPAGGTPVSLNDDSLAGGTRTLLDAPVAARLHVYIKNVDVRIARVTVIVAYDYARKSYRVTQNTLRTTDDF